MEESFLKKTIFISISIFLKFLLGQSFALIFTYVQELVPTKIRGSAVGISILVGRIGSSLISFVLTYEKQVQVHPLSYLFLPSLLSQILLIFLPETLHQNIKN